MGHFPTSFLRQIEGQAQLASVEVLEESRMLDTGLSVVEWSNSTAWVKAMRRFDAYHRGPVIGEDTGGCRPGHHPGKVEDFDIGQRHIMGHYTTPLFWRSANCCAVKPSSSM